MDWWWQQFTSAYHEGDPYKIISFNLDAAQAEAGDPERVAMTGTSASTYADGNLDVIGTMFYKGWGYKAILGLDHRYNNSYNYQLPILSFYSAYPGKGSTGIRRLLLRGSS